jgi:hypothetical protein
MSIAWENNTTALETQEFSIDPIINQKIKSAVQGLQKSVQNYFMEFPTERDKELVAEFLIACSQQENVAVKTRRVYLIALTYLCRFLENKKSFDAITSKELLLFSTVCTKTKLKTRSKVGLALKEQWV